MKVLLVGHGFGPGVGSEPGLPWHWARHLSTHHKVWLLGHPQHRPAVEECLAEHPYPNLHVVWASLPRRSDPWNPAQGEKGIRPHYIRWQREAYQVAKDLHARHRFDLVHHVGLSTVNVPSLFWKLSIPFVWGPIGGGQVAPRAFRRYFGSEWKLEVLRTVWLKMLPWLPALQKSARRSNLLLATNPETARLLARAGAPDARVYLDCGIPESFISPELPRREPRSELVLLWAGRLERRKALPLALEAIAEVNDVPVRLLIAGDGPLREEMESLSQRLRLRERVQFLGRLDWSDMPRAFEYADAFMFTSLRDSSGSVVLEAMAYGLPIVTLDHQGVASFVPSEASIKVKVDEPMDTVASIAQGIRYLAESPSARLEMGKAAWAYARTETWKRRAEQMSLWYQEACASFRCQGLQVPRCGHYERELSRSPLETPPEP